MRLKLNLPARLLATLPALLALSLLAPGVSAQTNHTPPKANTPAVSGNRFLFIVDTSASMKSTANDVLQAVNEVILSSASGQLHRGDTLGVWTFNKELYPGVLPLQTWAPENTNEIAARTLEFLRTQRYGRESRLDKALDGMHAVVKNSDILTIFLISNGQSPIQGTPFDQQINALYVESVKEMKKDRKPIVTVLQTKHGKIIKYTVNALPWPVVVPEVPITIKTAETAVETPPAAVPEKVAPAKPTPAPQPTPPLIVHQTPAPAPVITPPAAAPIVATPTPLPPVQPQSVPPVVPSRPIYAPPPATPSNPNSQPIAANLPGVSPLPPKPAAPPPRVVPPAIANKTIAATTDAPENNGESSPPTPTVRPPHRTHTNTPAIAKRNAPASTNNPAVVAMTDTVNHSKLLLIGAISGAVLAIAILLLLIRRSRTASGPSLISHTMGNPPKK